MIDWAHTFAGAVVGFIVGMTGVGGGALMTPIILLIFEAPVAQAVGTDLWFAAITKIASLYIYSTNHQINWQIVKRLWMGSVPISIILTIAIAGGYIEKFVHYIPTIIGVIILITSTALIFSNMLRSSFIEVNVTHNLLSTTKTQSILTILSGIALGALVSLTSIGAGVIGTIILIYLYSNSLSSKNIIATEVVHAIPLAMIAGTGYLIFGKVDFHMLVNLLIGSIPSVILGAFLAQKMSNKILKIILGIILFYSGLNLIM